jgi:hypothetical protein
VRTSGEASLLVVGGVLPEDFVEGTEGKKIVFAGVEYLRGRRLRNEVSGPACRRGHRLPKMKAERVINSATLSRVSASQEVTVVTFALQFVLQLRKALTVAACLAILAATAARAQQTPNKYISHGVGKSRAAASILSSTQFDSPDFAILVPHCPIVLPARTECKVTDSEPLFRVGPQDFSQYVRPPPSV